LARHSVHIDCGTVRPRPGRTAYERMATNSVHMLVRAGSTAHVADRGNGHRRLCAVHDDRPSAGLVHHQPPTRMACTDDAPLRCVAVPVASTPLDVAEGGIHV